MEEHLCSEGGITLKKYTTPQIDFTAITQKDILAQSDVLIDGSELFEEQ